MINRKQGKRFVRKALALLLTAVLALPLGVSASTMEEMESRRSELKSENEKIQGELDALANDEANAQAYQAALQEKIDNLEKSIDTAREDIETLNTSIAALEADLEAYRLKNVEVIEQFKDRVSALYTGGNVTTLEILLDSNSFTDYSLRSEMMQAVNKHDKELVEKLQQYMEETKAEREEVSKQKDSLAQVKKELEANQEEIQALEVENEELILTLQSQQAVKAETLAANEQEDEALNGQIQALIEERNRQEQLAREEEERRQQAAAGSGGGGSVTVTPTNPGMSSGFTPMWPLPGVGTGSITGHYGDMYFNGPHNGLDVGAPYGSPIVAAQAGQVLSAEYHYSWGNNVLLWHNDSFSTRYAHCSSLAVSPGQYVEQGQIIGYVGSTGESSGNHLHFEVYLNGARTNPENYLY